MKIIRAKILGFCMGVRRAVTMTSAAVSASPEPDVAPVHYNTAKYTPDRILPVYTLGPLIHNPQVLSFLSQRGVKILHEAEFVSGSVSLPKGASVIIRAHGISPDIEQMLCEQGARIIDATCPRVKANQNIASALAEKGYIVFLAGEKEHAEIKGIYGFAGNTNCIIAGNPEEAGQIASELSEQKKDSPVKTALIGQTTISGDEYISIAAAIKRYFPNLELKNTICDATRDRQDALRELCSIVDAVIIAGGKESANTRHLLSIARNCGKEAWLVETASDLPPALLQLPKAELAEIKIGLGAGASTPDSVIDEIEHALLLLG